MAKNYFERYIWLINTINRHGHISYNEISYLWSHSRLNKLGENYLPERTFHNHRQAILDTFGIEIKCDRSLGYYIANDEDMEEDGIRQKRMERPPTVSSRLPPIGGIPQPKVSEMTSVAFCPVVTSVPQRGIRRSSAGMSVGVTTSRNASDALSFKRRTSQAVS